VLHGAKLFKLDGRVGERLQPADGAAQLLLVVHHQKPQESKHLQGQREQHLTQGNHLHRSTLLFPWESHGLDLPHLEEMYFTYSNFLNLIFIKVILRDVDSFFVFLIYHFFIFLLYY